MSDGALHPTPRLPEVAREQFRVVGLAVRREAAAVVAFVVVSTLLALLHALRVGESMSLDSPADMAGLGVLAAAVAVLAPFAVWKGERRFGASPLWLLPVGHRRLALVKAVAGWGWLMLMVGTVLLWALLLVLVTGGSVGADEMRLVLDPTEPAGVRAVHWTTPWWTWLTPFVGASVAYLFGSALLLATEHPWKWVAGVGLAVLALGVIGEEGGVAWLNAAVEESVWTLLFGPHGFESLLTGGSLDGFTTEITLPTGETEMAWRLLPALGRWATAVLIWGGAGLAAVFAAASRHREG